MTTVRRATSRADLDDVRSLMRALVGWHRERHTEDIALIDRYFDVAAFADELAGLPGRYAPPRGSLLIADHGVRAAGCVALREVDADRCEMKRMYVPADLRGLGIGRALADQVIADARAAGYERMLLDTSHRQDEAIRLYERVGFRPIAPYYPVSEELAAWLVFFELDLTQ